jgi:hypothetical protein
LVRGARGSGVNPIMKPLRKESQATTEPDLEIDGACLGCDGILSIRVRPGTSRGVCRDCGFWACAQLSREEDGLHVRLPAAAEA